MTTPILHDAKTNGHADPSMRVWNASLVRLERRIVEIAETGEQRVAILRDALGDFCAAELAQRDHEIVALKKQIADLEQKLEQKTVVDHQVGEIVTRLEERAARVNEAKRGPPGRQGERGARGERGAPGKNGTTEVIKQTIKLERWDIDRASFAVRGVLSDGSEMPELNLRVLFEEYQAQVG